MPAFPISPLSPVLPLAKPSGLSTPDLGPIPNVPDGLLGIGGIGQVELPGVGVFTPGSSGGLTVPPLPGLSQSFPSSTQPAPLIAPAPTATGTPFPSVVPTPEVTPFPNSSLSQPTPTATPAPGAGPTPSGLPAATVPQPLSTPVPSGQPLQSPAQGSPYSTPPITTNQAPSLVQTPFRPNASAVPVKNTPLAQTFAKYLQQAASNYNQVQNQANSLIQRLAAGDKVDIHEVALALQKASITNQLAIQVRNRLVSAYQEIMRMQM